MKLIIKLIQSHKFLFFAAMFITFFSVFMNLYWNNFLAKLIDGLKEASFFEYMGADTSLPQLLVIALGRLHNLQKRYGK